MFPDPRAGSSCLLRTRPAVIQQERPLSFHDLMWFGGEEILDKNTGWSKETHWLLNVKLVVIALSRRQSMSACCAFVTRLALTCLYFPGSECYGVLFVTGMGHQHNSYCMTWVSHRVMARSSCPLDVITRTTSDDATSQRQLANQPQWTTQPTLCRHWAHNYFDFF